MKEKVAQNFIFEKDKEREGITNKIYTYRRKQKKKRKIERKREKE